MLKIWPITYSSPNCAWSEGESAEVKQVLYYNIIYMCLTRILWEGVYLFCILAISFYPKLLHCSTDTSHLTPNPCLFLTPCPDGETEGGRNGDEKKERGRKGEMGMKRGRKERWG